MDEPRAYSIDRTTEIKVAMSQTFDHLLPAQWELHFDDRMATQYGLDTKTQPTQANTRAAITGLLDKEPSFQLAVICTSLQDEMSSNPLIPAERVLELREEVVALDGLSLIAPLSGADPLISAITRDTGYVDEDLATTKARLLKALRGTLARGYRFAVREEGSGTRTSVESHVLAGIVREVDGRWRYGQSETLSPCNNNVDMVLKVADGAASDTKVLAVVADSILEHPRIDTSAISRIRILGVDRPFCLVRRRDCTSREVLACCDYIREANAIRAVEEGARAKRESRPPSGNRIFIGHGQSSLWRELKDFLHDRLGLPWEEFCRHPTAGIATTARLQQMLDAAGFAVLVMTAEDEHADASLHARENVIHEVGLFQGRLGFPKAIVLLEDGCSEFSNIAGLGQLRFPPGKISATFEELRRILEREGVI